MKRSVILLTLLAAGLSWAQTAAPKKSTAARNLISYIDERKDKNIAAFWSFAFPGAGQLYSKREDRFILMLGLRVAPVIAIASSEMDPGEKTGLIWGVSMVTLLMDVLSASRNAELYNVQLKKKYGFEFVLGPHSAGGRFEVQLSRR